MSLRNDISGNPGPQCTNNTWGGGGGGLPYFSFCNWNLNTLSKDEFSRVSLLNAHNSIHKYDIISLCETRLSVNEVVPANILPGYHYHACNHPSGEKKGGVGIFCKDSLPIIIRDDLSFDECIVVELRFGRKKSEKPYFLIFTGDFNAHSLQWWPDGDSNNEGTQLNILLSELGLTQLISEPTHFRERCQPSCIDLMICVQPNLVIDSGVRSSLDQSCKHQITYCKLNIKCPQIPSSKRLVWHYAKGKVNLINRAITDFQWDFYLILILILILIIKSNHS